MLPLPAFIIFISQDPIPLALNFPELAKAIVEIIVNVRVIIIFFIFAPFY
jgi:hypothetical protein